MLMDEQLCNALQIKYDMPNTSFEEEPEKV